MMNRESSDPRAPQCDPEEMLSQYLDGLGAGRDDRELLARLKQVSGQLGQPDWWEMAEMARDLHYNRLAERLREPLLAEIKRKVEPKLVEKLQTTLYEYLCGVIQAAGLTWPKVLSKIGVAPNQSVYLQRGSARVTSLLKARPLGRLASLIHADRGTVLRLALVELRAEPHPRLALAPLYRDMAGFRPGMPAHAEPSGDIETTIAQYIGELDEVMGEEHG